ncbi:PREDICTED: uncharacterized protein LOC109192931 [Ipomoea nil]|uniref:uncharacterized protein LOC109192931 n=1 Tax=Ipomoea nil TaxID=35883 RepID=UPI0009009B3A|nr:PREDICTED: uncharacterized protein LOC109192931 [Ipomoea nil]
MTQNDYASFGDAIPQLVIIVIIGATAVVLFKMNIIDGLGISRACWTIMLFGSNVLYSTEVSSLTTALIAVHICVNSLVLSYWIVVDVKVYKRKNAWPSMELLFETGLWLFMVILSWVEFLSRRLLKGKEYFHVVYYCHPIAIIALVSIIEKYLTTKMEISGDKFWKSELIENGDMTFDDLVRICSKEPQNGHVSKLDQKLRELTKMLSIVVAQKHEALKKEENRRLRGSRMEPKVGAQTNNNDQEIESMDL